MNKRCIIIIQSINFYQNTFKKSFIQSKKYKIIKYCNIVYYINNSMKHKHIYICK